MSYQGSAARRFEYAERAPRYGAAPQPAFDVVEGGGLDARARRGVSAAFVAYARLVTLAVVVFVVLGSLRVAITTATVTYLSDNLRVQDAIEDAEDLNASLRIERSVLSNSMRITRIATQNYGMVYVTDHDHVHIITAEEQAALDAAAAAELAARAQGTTANGSMIIEQGEQPVVTAQVHTDMPASPSVSN